MPNTNKTNSRLRVFGRAVKLKNGGEWIKYSLTTDGRKFYDLKFTRKCRNIPDLKGYVFLNGVEFSVQVKAGEKNEAGYQLNDIIWVNSIESYEEDIKSNEDYKKRRQEEENKIKSSIILAEDEDLSF